MLKPYQLRLVLLSTRSRKFDASSFLQSVNTISLLKIPVLSL